MTNKEIHKIGFHEIKWIVKSNADLNEIQCKFNEIQYRFHEIQCGNERPLSENGNRSFVVNNRTIELCFMVFVYFKLSLLFQREYKNPELNYAYGLYKKIL